MDLLKNNPIKSNYVGYVSINKERRKTKSGNTISDKTRRLIRDSGRRSTAESGGQGTVNELELSNIDSMANSHGFVEMIEILKVINTMNEIKAIEYQIGYLNEYSRWGAFTTLDYGLTLRKYLVAMISFNNNKTAILLEVERQTHSLSTLLLVGNNTMGLATINHNIIRGLIKRSGVWPDEAIARLEEKYHFEIHRFKHTSANIDAKVKRISGKII